MISKIVPDLEAALAGIQDGAVVLIGGFGGAGGQRGRRGHRGALQ